MDLEIEPGIQKDAINIQELTWEDVRASIKKLNKELFAVVEALSPSKKFSFIKARYPYGATIVNNGVLHLPLKSGKSIPIHCNTINSSIKNKLNYSPIPLTLLLNKSSEVFVKNYERIIPLKLIQPGKLFGLFEVVNILSHIKPEPIWWVTSGASSVFMLPKITDKLGYQRLKKELSIPLNAPHFLSDHYEVFTQISNHPTYINEWYSDILFFCGEWFNKAIEDTKWIKFYNYLYKEANYQSYFARDEIAFNLTSQCLSVAIGSRNLRPRPYILDTVRHLIAIAIGSLPGFRPADNSQIALPSKLIQNAFVNFYGLKNYLPTIMQPYNLMLDKSLNPTYYSLAYPSLLEGTPPHKLHPDVIADLREVKLLIDTLYTAIEIGKVVIPKAHSLLHRLQFEYFHSGKDMYNEVQSTKNMLTGDSALIADQETYPNLGFCFTAPFLSGCIKLSQQACDKITTS